MAAAACAHQPRQQFTFHFIHVGPECSCILENRCFDCGISTDAIESSVARAVFDPDSDGQSGTGEIWNMTHLMR
ncbi:hypothetical protein JEQ12_003350 [Ovis aries]|uniref:Uncharacterized protein n=1 Tax=Ovis aries TaxID=9940 RepID=A0A836AB04_SHEEP|nr:hypothetical protein JEQ12_003350 [Ovis aries]